MSASTETVQWMVAEPTATEFRNGIKRVVNGEQAHEQVREGYEPALHFDVEVTVTPMHAEGASTTTLEFAADATLTIHNPMWTPEDGEPQYYLCIRGRRADGSLRIENGILDIDTKDDDRFENGVGRDEPAPVEVRADL